MLKPLMLISLLICAPAGAAAVSAAAPTTFEQRCAALSTSGSDAARLHQLFDLTWKYQQTEYPEDATYNGFPGVNDRWTDWSAAAVARRRQEAKAPLDALKTIRREALGAADQLSYDLFRRSWETRVEGLVFPDELLPLSQMSGPQQLVPGVLALMPHTTEAHMRDLYARLDKVPALIDQTIALLEEGCGRQITPPRITLRDVPGQIEQLLVDDPEKNALMLPFKETPAHRAEGLRLVRTRAIPAFRKFLEFVRASYLPRTRETTAWNALPEGAHWYAFRVRRETTTHLTPAEIHETGLREVKRIRGEMDEVIKQSGFKGSFAEFCTFLRTSPQFFFDKPEELLRSYRDIAKRVDPGLIQLFGRLPTLPYGVKPVPPYAEKSQTTAYYEQGSPESARAGYFFANTYNLKTRPKWEMEALTLHEAVPGHHLQIALAQELPAVPEFRKHADYTAYIEGWGLYAESLGKDLGLYQDPYSRFGQLTYEMWRAVRLVVDTGMHSLGWSRDRAIRFFTENTSKTEHDIVVEVDRYIVWAGQALAYKIGELKIKELREKAHKELGERFDLRGFHDAVLGQGAVPLDQLEVSIGDWIKSRRGH